MGPPWMRLSEGRGGLVGKMGRCGCGFECLYRMLFEVM